MSKEYYKKGDCYSRIEFFDSYSARDTTLSHYRGDWRMSTRTYDCTSHVNIKATQEGEKITEDEFINKANGIFHALNLIKTDKP